MGKESRRRRWKRERRGFFEVFWSPQKTRKNGDKFSINSLPKIVYFFLLKLDRCNLHYKTWLEVAPDSQKAISKFAKNCLTNYFCYLLFGGFGNSHPPFCRNNPKMGQKNPFLRPQSVSQKIFNFFSLLVCSHLLHLFHFSSLVFSVSSPSSLSHVSLLCLLSVVCWFSAACAEIYHL